MFIKIFIHSDKKTITLEQNKSIIETDINNLNQYLSNSTLLKVLKIIEFCIKNDLDSYTLKT